MLRVILVEDDGDQAEDIRRALVSAFGDVSVETITSESDFQQAIYGAFDTAPHVIVIDIMIQGSAEGQSEFPAETPAFHMAGFRCEALLRSRGDATPVILYSVLDRSVLEESLARVGPNTQYVMKELHLNSLTNVIGKLVSTS